MVTEQRALEQVSCLRHRTVQGRPRVLVLLFGDVTYDGRAQRTVRVLTELADVTLLDAAAGVIPATETRGYVHRRVTLLRGWGRARRHLAFWRMSRRLANETKPALVLAASFYACLAGRIAAAKVGARLVYDAYELIIPEAGRAMDGGDYFRYWLERLGVGRADLVFAANACRAKLMQRHYALPQRPVVFRNVPPQPVLSAQARVSPLDGQACAGLPALAGGEVRLLYQGDINLGRGLGRFLEVMHELPANIRLVLAGGGKDEQAIRAILAERGLKARVFCLGRIPNRQLPLITRQCHIGIVTYPYTGLNNIHCAPNKVFEYAQAGLPVVTTDQPPLRSMVTTFGIGELLRWEADSREVADIILRLVESLPVYQQQLPLFLAANRWESEAERVRLALQPLLAGRGVE